MTADADTADAVYEDLKKFVRYLAKSNGNSNNVMMAADELEGELWVEVAKGLNVYGELPHNELLAVLRRMIDNRLAELKYRHYITHRAAENNMVDIDGLWDEPDSSSPEDVVASLEKVRRVRDSLSPMAKQVFDAIVVGDERIMWQCQLAGMRRAYVYANGGTVTINSHIISVALAIDGDKAKACMREIKKAWRAK